MGAVHVLPVLALASVVAANAGCGSLLVVAEPPPQQLGTGPDCLGTGLLRACTSPPYSAAPLPVEIDTSGADCTMAIDDVIEGVPICVIVRSDIAIKSVGQGTLRAVGTRALVLVSRTTIEVEAGTSIDVSSNRNELGAGGSSTRCGARTSSSPAGGSGGSFRGRGGDGGDVPGIEGTPAAPSTEVEFHGGCPGTQDPQVSFGRPGRGGGAVYLIAHESILINGLINASGSSGHGGEKYEPGGGGGSGGFIGLDAPTILGSGVLMSNGGGGGGAGNSTAAGQPGRESIPFINDYQVGEGGAAAPGGGAGAGGNGSIDSAIDGSSGVPGALFGGGGGGGAGWIYVSNNRSFPGKQSPAPR